MFWVKVISFQVLVIKVTKKECDHNLILDNIIYYLCGPLIEYWPFEFIVPIKLI